MRILVISDIHANLTAIEAVLDSAGKIDAAWCLGDLIGYGPDPNEVVSKIQSLPNLVCLLGNHDAAALGNIDTSTFNPEARKAVNWTQSTLSSASIKFLKTLPERTEVGQVTLSHGSPRFPVWEYLLDTRTATQNFDFFSTPFCFVGHTHLPVVYNLDGVGDNASLSIPEPNSDITLTWRTIINPGSVGQPRDRDPRASFAIYQPEDNLWSYKRVEYDIHAVQERMRIAQLPDRHIQRLSAGW